MKVKTMKVKRAVMECRQVIIDAIVELLRQIGAEDYQDVVLDRTLIMHQTTKDGTTRTFICDRVMYVPYRAGGCHLATSMGPDDYRHYKDSSMLSLDNLQMLYDEVVKVARAH